MDANITGSSESGGDVGTLRAFRHEDRPVEFDAPSLESGRKQAHSLPGLIPFAMLAICTIFAALAGALAESLPLQSADNPRVGFAAAIGIVATDSLFFANVPL